MKGCMLEVGNSAHCPVADEYLKLTIGNCDESSQRLAFVVSACAEEDNKLLSTKAVKGIAELVLRFETALEQVARKRENRKPKQGGYITLRVTAEQQKVSCCNGFVAVIHIQFEAGDGTGSVEILHRSG